jgi:hypothetical protein
MSVLLAAFEVADSEVVAELRAVRDRIAVRARPVEQAAGWYGCADGHPDVERYLARRARDEEIKRLTGQLRADEEYDDWAPSLGKSRLWDLDDEEIEEFEREAETAAHCGEYVLGQLRADIQAVAARIRSGAGHAGAEDR